MARHVFEDDDGVIDDKPGGDGQRHQRQIVEAVAHQIHRAERADQRHRHRDARDQHRARVAQEREHHQDHQADRDDQRRLDIVQRGADRRCPVHHHPHRDAVRDRRLQRWQRRGDAVDRVDDVGIRLAVEDHQHRRLPVGKTLVAQILDRVDDRRDIGEAHRRTVAVGDHQRQIIRRLGRLVVGVDLKMLVLLLDRTLWTMRVGRGKRGPHVLKPDSVFVERHRVQFDPNRRQRAAADRHLADAVDLRQGRRQHGRGGVVDLARGERLRSQRQDGDRRVGRVYLAIARIGPQARRQVGACRVDRRLHVARGAVDIAIQIELQGDAGRAERARRGHLGHIGDNPEMTLQRRRHRLRHRLGAGAGHLREDRDRREIDLRQRRYRQLIEREYARERQADGQ